MPCWRASLCTFQTLSFTTRPRFIGLQSQEYVTADYLQWWTPRRCGKRRIRRHSARRTISECALWKSPADGGFNFLARNSECTSSSFTIKARCDTLTKPANILIELSTVYGNEIRCHKQARRDVLNMMQCFMWYVQLHYKLWCWAHD